MGLKLLAAGALKMGAVAKGASGVNGGMGGLIGVSGMQGMPVKVFYLNCNVLGHTKLAELQSLLSDGSYDVVFLVEVGHHRWDLPGYVRYGSKYTGHGIGPGRLHGYIYAHTICGVQLRK